MVKHVLALLMVCLHLLTGCSIVRSMATDQLADDVALAILDQNDPITVRDGAPAYLILIDGLIARSPDSEELLMTGARLYGAYATLFVDDSERARGMADKAWLYSKRALCIMESDRCEDYLAPYERYVEFLQTLNRSSLDVLYIFAVSWAGWIDTHSNDWNARASIPKVEATMRRVIELDERYSDGEPHLYLGVLSIILPPALGGKPDQAKIHFERAIALSNGRNLLAKVLYAEHYGRKMFDRDLHDRLLTEVLAANPESPRATLMNSVAQGKARQLLDSADAYF